MGTGRLRNLNLPLNNGASQPPAQTEREALFHALAVAHLQRVRTIELLTAIDRKLEILVDLALRNEGSRS
jgi:hypothetical protein